MKLQEAEDFAENLIWEGYEAKVREEYSGRSMYGRTTSGVVTNAPEVEAGRVFAAKDEDEDDEQEENDYPTRLRVDSMGLSIIYY